MLGKLKKNYFLLIVTFLFIYFFFNLLDGNRGLISYIEKKEIYENLVKKENELLNKINDLEHKNSSFPNKNFSLIKISTKYRFRFC